jgi:hypothetical protein
MVGQQRAARRRDATFIMPLLRYHSPGEHGFEPYPSREAVARAAALGSPLGVAS